MDDPIEFNVGITLEEAVIRLRRRSELTDDLFEALALRQAANQVQQVADRLAAARKWGAENSVV